MSKEKLLEELRALNNIIRGFCESFDCKDLPCDECPIGPDICLALGKDNIEKKYVKTNRIGTLLYYHWKDVLLLILITLLVTSRWW